MEQNPKIKELQLELESKLNRLDEIKELIKIYEQKYCDALLDYFPKEKELESITDDINKLDEEFNTAKQNYIETNKKKLLLKLLLCGSTSSLILALIITFVLEITSIGIISTTLLGTTLFGLTTSILIYELSKEKYITKLETIYNKRKSTEIYNQRRNQKLEEKKEKLIEYNIKLKKLEKIETELETLNNQSKDIINNLKDLKETIIKLIVIDYKKIESVKAQNNQSTKEENNKTNNVPTSSPKTLKRINK